MNIIPLDEYEFPSLELNVEDSPKKSSIVKIFFIDFIVPLVFSLVNYLFEIRSIF